jgi:hypothetical protein
MVFRGADPANLARLQTETPKSTGIENKGVPTRKQNAVLQFPSGDDVSIICSGAKHRLLGWGVDVIKRLALSLDAAD